MQAAHPGDRIRKDLERAGHHELAATIDKVESFVAEWWARGAILYWFTDHGPDHSRRVADLALTISDIPSLPAAARLTPLESYVLWAAAFLHDVGMQSLLGQPAGTQNPLAYAQIRHEHPNESYVVINAQWERIGLPDDMELVGAIALVARAHGTKYYKDSTALLEGVDQLHGERVRTTLLAAILLIADELDLDVRRVVPPPARQPLGVVSQAHAAKHRMVSRGSVEHRAQGRVGFHLHLSPNGCTDVQAAAVEKWIVEKLRIQMALVEPAFTNGFAGNAELDRNIRVTHQKSLAQAAPLAPPVIGVIEDEVIANELIDHDRNLQELTDVVERHGAAVITGRMLDFEDVDGREDLAAALAAIQRGHGRRTLCSRVLYEGGGAASLRDVLIELLVGLETDDAMHDYATSDEILATLATRLSSTSDILIWISSVEMLPAADIRWIQDALVSTMRSLDNVSLVFTSAEDSPLCEVDGMWTVKSRGMDAEEVQIYLSRYVAGRPARVEAMQRLRYSSYKRMRQDYIADMIAGSQGA
jgi:hypothetical protein